MKTLAMTIIVAVGCLTLASNRPVAAQSICNGRCETQYETCHAGAEAVLEECLDRAIGGHEKVKCATAFVKLEDACRTTEAACLSNCPTS
jgi:hypothetical protein